MVSIYYGIFLIQLALRLIENNRIFDSILSTYKQFAVVTNPNAQRARLGISLIAIGIYIMWVGLCLFVIDNPDEKLKKPVGIFGLL